MIAWRVAPEHHSVQEAGREGIFADYRIRIAQVMHEERPDGSIWNPERLSPYNDPARRPPTFVVASESCSQDVPVEPNQRSDVFESAYRPGVFAHLFDVSTPEDGIKLGRQLLTNSTTEYFRVFDVMRDYGIFDRAEAPQYYPPVAATHPWRERPDRFGRAFGLIPKWRIIARVTASWFRIPAVGTSSMIRARRVAAGW